MVVHYPGDSIMDHTVEEKKLIFDSEKMDPVGTLIYRKTNVKIS